MKTIDGLADEAGEICEEVMNVIDSHRKVMRRRDPESGMWKDIPTHQHKYDLDDSTRDILSALSECFDALYDAEQRVRAMRDALREMGSEE